MTRSRVFPAFFRLLALLTIIGLSLPNRASGAAPRPDAVAARYTFIAPVDHDTNITTNNETPWGDEPRLFVLQNGGSTSRWSALLRFDLSVIPAGSRVITATAHFYVEATDSTPINLHRVTAAWDEATITWNTLGAQYVAAPATVFAPPGRNRTVQVDITALAQAWLSAAAPNHGILLRTPQPASDHTLKSKETADPAQRPYLEIVVEDARLETAADDFDPNTGYAGSDGGLPWLDPWLEIGETDGPTAGLVRAEISTKCTTGACLHIPALGADAIRRGVERGVNLTGATAAVLSFAFRQSGRTGQVDLEASGDGGAHWSRLKSYIVTTASANPTRQSVSLLPHAAPDTRIRFIGAGGAGDGILYVDNVRVDAVRQGIGGQVWDDLNRDGAQAITEPGLRGITVKLHHSTCAAAAGPAYRTTVTGDDGYYAFTPLAAGVYCARPDTATLPAGYALTSAAAAREVTLAAAQFYDAADFGYAVAAAPDRLLVAAYAPCADATWLQQIAQTYSATIIGQNSAICGYTVQVAPANQAALQAAINADAHTRRADPDTWAHTAFTPNDPDYADPWLVYGPRRIHADAAWDVTRGAPQIIIAVLDSGLALSHPEFAGRIVPGYDFVNSDSDPTDDQQHGTHVTGIAAAGIHNGIGMAGIAGDARILPVKALNAKGGGWWSDIARGVTWAVDQGARVLSLSLAGTSYSQALYDAIAYANSKGAVVIAAAGNNGMSAPTYPASFDNVIAVGASDYDDLRMSFSNYGVNVDVMAPGDSIWSTYPGGYGYMSGTSMAAPHAAGVAALLLSVNPNLTPAQIRDRLQATATDMDAPGVDEYTGYGLINAGAAVAGMAPAPFVTPTTSLAAILDADANGNGLVDPGDTLRYLVTVANGGTQPLSDVMIQAPLPLYTSYVISDTELSGIPVRDDAIPQSALPLDEGGLNIGTVPPGGSVTISFDVVVNQPPRGVYALIGQATVQAGTSSQAAGQDLAGDQALQVVTPLAGTLVQAGVDLASAHAGQTLTYTFTTDYLGRDLLSNAIITAPLPAGTSYVAGSANAGGTLASELVTWNLGSNAAGYSNSSPGNALSATPTLVTSGGLVTVTQILTASQNSANVTPSALTITATNGVTATRLSGPAPISATVGISGTAFTWVYQASSPAGNIGQLTFGGRATAGSDIWPWAQSNSVIVHPPLTFRATVADPPTASPVNATGYFRDATTFPLAPSNLVQTTIQASIGDRAWADLDGDGVQDGGEPGLPGLQICAAAHAAGTGGGCAATDPQGAYHIFGLTAGAYYTVTLNPTTAPANHLATTPDSFVRAATTAGIADADFGLQAIATTLGDYIWYDANANGLQDVDEPGLANVTLALYRDDGDGVFEPPPGIGRDTFIATTVSDAAGVYALRALGAGSYFVDVTDDHGVLAGLVHTVGPQSAAEPTPPIAVNLGDSYRAADFGYIRAVTGGLAIIGDLVWLDGNHNRARELTEPILSGVQVCAAPVAGGTGGGCALTDLNGRYLLPVAAGVYTVTPTAPPLGLIASTPAPISVTVAAGQQYLAADFGYFGSSAALGGTIWQDLPVDDVTDGIFNPATESGLANVSVNVIRDANADGVWDSGEPILATFSGPSGDYLFADLLPGVYLAQVSDTLAALRRFAISTLGPTPGQDFNNQRQPYSVTLGAGQTDTTADFGYRELEAFSQGDPADPGVIGDLVWYDVNGDGVYTPAEGDHAIAGVTVALTRDGAAYASVTTNGYGQYLFSDLALGHSYGVQVTDAFGVLNGLQRSAPGPDPGQDGQNQTQPYTITLGLRRDNRTADFGYFRPVSLGGRVFFDINVNGIADAGEPSISDVTLDVYRQGIKFASPATDAAGLYAFAGPADAYTITVTPAEFTAGGTLYRWTPTYTPTLPLTLTAGQALTAADFGLTILSSYTVTQQLNISDPLRPNEPISFTIRITNTGYTWLTALQLTDVYSPTYLTYGVGGGFARPDSDDHENDGTLTWANALSVTRGGPGILPPGASTAITVWFTTLTDSGTAGARGALNRGAVTAPQFDPDGPGLLPAGASLLSRDATAYVRILDPTGLTVVSFRATAGQGRVTLAWQTANEAQLLGFNILRRVSNGPLQPVNAELVLAEHAGSNQGAAYTFTDKPTAGAYAYLLEVIHADGSRTRTNPTAVRVAP